MWGENNFPASISTHIKQRCLSVRLFACLFRFGTKLLGRIPTKFGMGHTLGPVGNLEMLFWVDPPKGGII